MVLVSIVRYMTHMPKYPCPEETWQLIEIQLLIQQSVYTLGAEFRSKTPPRILVALVFAFVKEICKFSPFMKHWITWSNVFFLLYWLETQAPYFQESALDNGFFFISNSGLKADFSQVQPSGGLRGIPVSYAPAEDATLSFSFVKLLDWGWGRVLIKDQLVANKRPVMSGYLR